MKNKILILYLLFPLLSAAGVFAFADDPNSSYLSDINNLNEKTSENIKDVDQSIAEQADSKRRQEREEKARGYYQKGVELANEGKLDEARLNFEKAISISEHPEAVVNPKEDQVTVKTKKKVVLPKQNKNDDQGKENEAARAREKERLIQQAEKERMEEVNNQAQEVYAQAVDLYRNEKFDEAKKKFEEVNLVIPDYRSTKRYLARIDRAIQKEKERLAQKQQRELEDQQKALDEQRLQDEADRKKQEAERQHELEVKEYQHKMDLQEQAESLYTAAVGLFDHKSMDEALEKFDQIESLFPDYKSTRTYIARIEQIAQDKKREEQEQQKQLLEAQKEAQEKAQEEKQRLAQEHERELVEQQKALQEQQWQEELDRKKQEAQRQHELELKEYQHKMDLQEQAQSLYTAAVDLFDHKSMDEALDKFNQIESLYPDFKSTKAYIVRIEQWKIDQQKQLLESQKEAQAQQEHQKELEQERQQAQELKEKNDQTEKIYQQALSSYRDRQYEAAKEVFLKVKDRDANYKSTQYYLGKIDVKIREAQAEQEHQKELEQQRQRAEILKEKNDQTQNIYDQALSLYRDHQWEGSKVQFEAVEKMIPDFKHTHRYLQKIEVLIAKEAAAKQSVAVVKTAALPVAPPVIVPPVVVTPPVVAAPVVVPPAPAPVAVVTNFAPSSSQAVEPAKVKPAVSLEDQQKQAQDISILADKSAQLYQQIAAISDDKYTVQTKIKMAQVDNILSNLKDKKERLLKHQRDEDLKRQQEERKAELERMYHDALGSFDAHEYAKAKVKFQDLEIVYPNYRATRRYLSRIDDYETRTGEVKVVSHEKQEVENFKQLQDKQNVEQTRHVQEEQQKDLQLEQEQQESLKALAQKASDINDDIIRLSKAEDYDAVKAKFEELENTLASIKALKAAMAEHQNDQADKKQILRDSIDHRNEAVRSLSQEDMQIYTYDKQQASKENRLALSGPASDIGFYKRREIVRELDSLFSEGVDCFAHKKYTEAKLLFGELADKHDRRAEAWLKKVDRAITRELLSSQESEERERTAFIADQLKAQRELVVIQERERQRQKRLTEELEYQKRLYEDDRLLQLRKEEIMKTQVQERQRQEEKRQQLEKEKEKQQETFRFHKISTPPKSTIEEKPQPVIVPKVEPKIALPVPSSDLAAKQLQAQKEQQDQIKAQREVERQAKLKAEAEQRDERAKAQAAQLAQEQERKQEVLHQQEQQREEKIKQEEIMREEAQRRQDLERQERQRQAQLEAQREAVRKQLEDGVEAMYQEALSLYKQGDYSSAADKFKDVQDILPGYKRSAQYMDEARQKASAEPIVSAADSATTPVSHQDNISKALDLFDPNAK